MDPHRYLNPVPVRVVRDIPSDGPVMDITSSDIACNQGGNNGTAKVFDVNAGSDMTFKWTNVRPPPPILRLPFDLPLCHRPATVAK